MSNTQILDLLSPPGIASTSHFFVSASTGKGPMPSQPAIGRFLNPGSPPPELYELESRLRDLMACIPISEFLEFTYVPSGAVAHALVAHDVNVTKMSDESVIMRVDELVYAEAGSQRGELYLFDVKQKPQGINLPWCQSKSGGSFVAQYDRSPSRAITQIYLPEQEIRRAAFKGTLKAFQEHPHVRMAEKAKRAALLKIH